MCRFLVYKGSKDIILSKLITEPSHSILTQSYDSRLRLDTRRPVNGDGFGVGWYTDAKLGTEPCIFTSTLPAWNCVNLERIAPKTCSHLIFAHVRATTEGALAESNCHPFQHNTLMFMHNGNIGGWKYVKRSLADSLKDKYYLGVKGGTDSEWAFALYLDILEKEGVDPSSDPGEKGFGQNVLREAMTKTIAKINEFVKAIPPEYQVTDIETRSLLNFAVTDGHTVVCTRYVSSKKDAAASLYYSSGTNWVEGQTKGNFRMERRDKGSDIVLVASEPLTFERRECVYLLLQNKLTSFSDNWLSVPTNAVLTIHRQTVSIRPITDEYHDPDPCAERSSCFASAKGLVSKAPGGPTLSPSDSTGGTPAATPALTGKLQSSPRDRFDELSKKMATLQVQT